LYRFRTAIVTLSDKAFRGEREDLSGPLLSQLASAAGADVIATHLIPDDQQSITTLLVQLADEEKVDIILTTGGTGPSSRDNTPEATRAVIEREMPGLAELMRWDGYRRTPFAVLSRGVAGIRGKTLIVNLPGSPKAVREGMEVLAPLLPSAVALIKDDTPLDGLCTAGNLIQEEEDKHGQ
jgi:molybdopterin adenylyltransferase